MPLRSRNAKSFLVLCLKDPSADPKLGGPRVDPTQKLFAEEDLRTR